MGWVRDARGVETRALHSVADFRGRRVLEVGCGDGRLTWGYAAAAASVLAVDPCPKEIAMARASRHEERAPHVRFEVGVAQELELPPASFDIALLPWSL